MKYGIQFLDFKIFYELKSKNYEIKYYGIIYVKKDYIAKLKENYNKRLFTT